MTMSLLELPSLLRARYIEYLWNYEPGSWVDASASTFRLFAAFIIIPLALLVMLDVTSYIIARTLGVIDDTKASTSDRRSLHPVAAVEGPPAIIVQSASMPISPSLSTDAGQPLGEIGEKLRLEIDRSRSHPQSESSSSLYEGNPALAGVGVFSPAASTPPSPTLERRRVGSLSMSSTTMTPLNQLDNENGSSEKVITDGETEEVVIKSRVGRKGSWGSMSAGLDSSYALVDKDSGSEDSGVPLRRRQKVPTMEPIDS